MAQRKENKAKIKVRDLKPKKDAKGGVMVDVNAHVQQHNRSVQRQNQNHSINRIWGG